MRRAYHGDWLDALPSKFIGRKFQRKRVEKNEMNVLETDDF